MNDSAPDTRSGAVRILALTHEQFRYTSENSTVYSWPMKPKTHIKTAATLHALAAERDIAQAKFEQARKLYVETLDRAVKAEAEVARLRERYEPDVKSGQWSSVLQEKPRD